MKYLGWTGFILMVLALDLASPVRAQTAVAEASTAVREKSWKVAGLGVADGHGGVGI